MNFFKKKSNKQSIESKQHLTATNNHEGPKIDNNLKTVNNSLLQFNLLDDFSSTITIPQLQEDAIQKKTHNSIISEIKPNTKVKDEIANASSPSIDANIIPRLSSNFISQTYDNESNDLLHIDSASTSSYISTGECQNNASDSLTDPVGEVRLTPGNRISPLSCEREEETVLQDKSNNIAVEEKLYEMSARYDTVKDLYEKRENVKQSCDKDGTFTAPGRGSKNIQPVIELQIASFTTSTCSSTVKDEKAIANEQPTKLSECELEVNSRSFEHKSQEVPRTEVDSLDALAHISGLNDLSSVGSIQFNEIHGSQNLLPNLCNEEGDEASSFDSEDDDEGKEETKFTATAVNNEENTEIADSTINQEVMDIKERKIDKKIEVDNQKTNVTTKRKSAHSFIPRKQNVQTSSSSEKESVQITDLIDDDLIDPTLSFTNYKEDLQDGEPNVVTRRGSSSSFLPVPHQQNRLSLILSDINTNSAIVSSKNWSPSSSSESMVKNSSHTLLCSESTSSSSGNSSDNATTRRKRVPSSKKQMESGIGSARGKLGGTNCNQGSKIPIFTTPPSRNPRNDMQRVLPSIPNINVTISRLPVKRNPTAV